MNSEKVWKKMEFEITSKFEAVSVIKIVFLQFWYWPIPYRISTWTGSWTSKHVVRKVKLNSNYWPKRSGKWKTNIGYFLKFLYYPIDNMTFFSSPFPKPWSYQSNLRLLGRKRLPRKEVQFFIHLHTELST